MNRITRTSLFVAALVLAGCGGSSSSPPSDSKVMSTVKGIVADNSNGLIQVNSIEVTKEGESTTVNGRFYDVNFKAELEFTDDCWFSKSNGQSLEDFFVAQPSAANQSPTSVHLVQIGHKGQKLAFSSNIKYMFGTSGWERFNVGKMFANAKAAADAEAAKVSPEDQKKALDAKKAKRIRDSADIYGMGFGGKYPDNLGQLVAYKFIKAEDMISPYSTVPGPNDLGTWKEEDRQKWIDANCSYVYVAGATTTQNPKTIVLFDKIQIAKLKNTMTIVYNTGTTTDYSLEEGRKILEAYTGKTLEEISEHTDFTPATGK